MTTEQIIKSYIVEEIFSEFPLVISPFDLYVEMDDETTEGFVISEAYELETVRDIKSLMVDKLDSLLALKKQILENERIRIKIGLSEEDLEDLRDGKVFNWTYESENNLTSVDVELKKEEW